MLFRLRTRRQARPGSSGPIADIRRLDPDDRDRFLAHLNALDRNDFRDRFNGFVSQAWLDSLDLAVEVAWERVPAKAQLAAWYDPRSERIRG